MSLKVKVTRPHFQYSTRGPNIGEKNGDPSLNPVRVIARTSSNFHTKKDQFKPKMTLTSIDPIFKGHLKGLTILIMCKNEDPSLNHGRVIARASSYLSKSIRLSPK